MHNGEAAKLLLDAYSITDAQLELVRRLMHLDAFKNLRAGPLLQVSKTESVVNLEAELEGQMAFQDLEQYMGHEFQKYDLRLKDDTEFDGLYRVTISAAGRQECVSLHVNLDGNV